MDGLRDSDVDLTSFRIGRPDCSGSMQTARDADSGLQITTNERFLARMIPTI
jgi:hypothetical protein